MSEGRALDWGARGVSAGGGSGAVQLMVRLGRLKRAGKRYAYALRSISAGAAPRAGHTQKHTPHRE